MESFSKTIRVETDHIDANGHVNNVAYIHWMQDLALEHYAALGGMQAQGDRFTWVVREHRVEYLLPAFAGEELLASTWVENIRRVRSLRKYEFRRKSDNALLVRGETDWVFVEVKTGRPQAVPDAVKNILLVSGESKNHDKRRES